jgi:hypothetical protein
VKFKELYRSGEYDAKTFIERALDGNDYDNGAVETAMTQAKNTSEAFAMLVSMLLDKNILSPDDVYKLARQYPPKSTFLD